MSERETIHVNKDDSLDRRTQQHNNTKQMLPLTSSSSTVVFESDDSLTWDSSPFFTIDLPVGRETNGKRKIVGREHNNGYILSITSRVK